MRKIIFVVGLMFCGSLPAAESKFIRETYLPAQSEQWHKDFAKIKKAWPNLSPTSLVSSRMDKSTKATGQETYELKLTDKVKTKSLDALKGIKLHQISLRDFAELNDPAALGTIKTLRVINIHGCKWNTYICIQIQNYR